MAKKSLSKTQEKQIAELFGGRVQPASGAFEGFKSDITSKHVRIECKATEKKSISIKADYLTKITEEAAQHGQRPVLALRIESPHSKLMPVSKDWALIEADFLAELLAMLDEKPVDK